LQNAQTPRSQTPKFHVYIGDIKPDSVLIAWGTTAGDNTIGRTSPSHGPAVVKINGRDYPAEKNWLRIGGLAPDRDYPYEVWLRENKIGGGAVRTFPAQSRRLVFLVIGDYGNGDEAQRHIARAMTEVVEQRRAAGDPVRFILTTGDNIYANTVFGLPVSQTGDRDLHWGRKFFDPYAWLLSGVPFYPVLGNHDGNESEAAGDLGAYLDNFFFAGDNPARFYRFQFGGLVDFFALDTTSNVQPGVDPPGFGKESKQFQWLLESLRASKAPWKIAYFHHPPFTGGPRHPPRLYQLQHIVDALGEYGVQVVFTGHEHNLQFSLRSKETRGVQYVVTGAAGELRGDDIRRGLTASQIASWSNQRHYLMVEIEDRVLRITPLSDVGVRVRDHDGASVGMPLRIER